MAGPTTGQTIIIKKINKGAHGHHGGAWKVAYADFVTAMMAFFLLMWLLNATEAESLSGLADYFAPTVGISGNMGIGFRGGKAILSKGVGADKNTNKGIVFGGVPTGPIVKVTEVVEQNTEEAEAEKISVVVGKAGTTDKQGDSDTETKNFTEMAESLQSYISEAASAKGAENKVSVVESPEGLEIQVRDVQGEPMFKEGTSELQPKIKVVLAELAGIIKNLPNYIAITGYTSSIPVHGKPGYSNWELSADRANATRRFLLQSGVQPEQVERVVGRADNQPVDAKHPAASVNNRLSIIMLRRAMVPEYKKGAPEGVFLDPKSAEAQDLIKDDDVKKTAKPGPKKDEGAAKKDDSSNARLLQEKDENVKEFEKMKVADPMGNGVSINPLDIKDDTARKPSQAATSPNAKLLEDKDKDTNMDEFQSLPVQDPLSSGAAVNPLGKKE